MKPKSKEILNTKTQEIPEIKEPAGLNTNKWYDDYKSIMKDVDKISYNDLPDPEGRIYGKRLKNDKISYKVKTNGDFAWKDESEVSEKHKNHYENKRPLRSRNKNKISNLMVSTIVIILLIPLVICLKPIQPDLGDIYDCRVTMKTGLYDITTKHKCNTQIFNEEIKFEAETYRYDRHEEQMFLFECTAFKWQISCKEEFLGHKYINDVYIETPTKAEICRNVVKTGRSPDNIRLIKMSENEMETPLDTTYDCSWMTTKYYIHKGYKYRKMPAIASNEQKELIQEITPKKCFYDKSSCQPENMNLAIIYGKKPKMRPIYKNMGKKSISRVINTLEINPGGFAGDIITEDEEHIVLDTNIIIFTKTISVKKKYEYFKQAKNGIKKEKLTTFDVIKLENDFDAAKFIMNALNILYAEICKMKQQESILRHMMLSKIPETAGGILNDMRGHIAENRGEGMLIKKCKAIKEYELINNREITTNLGTKKCYKDLPVNISNEIVFLDLTTRNIKLMGNQRSCETEPPVLLAKDTNNEGFKLNKIGIWSKVEILSKSIHDSIKIPKIHEYNPEWEINEKLELPRENVIDIIRESQELTKVLMNEDLEGIWEGDGSKSNLNDIEKQGKLLIGKATNSLWTPVKKELIKIIYILIPIIAIIIAIIVTYCILKKFCKKNRNKRFRFQDAEAQYGHEILTNEEWV